MIYKELIHKFYLQRKRSLVTQKMSVLWTQKQCFHLGWLMSGHHPRLQCSFCFSWTSLTFADKFPGQVKNSRPQNDGHAYCRENWILWYQLGLHLFEVRWCPVSAEFQCTVALVNQKISKCISKCSKHCWKVRVLIEITADSLFLIPFFLMEPL